MPARCIPTTSPRSSRGGTRTRTPRSASTRLGGVDGFVIRAVRPLAETVTAVRADGTRVALEHVGERPLAGLRTRAPARPTRSRPRYDDGADLDRRRPVPLRAVASARSTSTSGARAATSSSGTCSARTSARTRASSGTAFSVWAPHAQAVRVIGDFNGWDGTRHAMRRLDDNGVWELFVPGLQPGTTYKFELLTAGRRVGASAPTRWRGTPRCRRPPASVVGQIALRAGATPTWMTQRARRPTRTTRR